MNFVGFPCPNLEGCVGHVPATKRVSNVLIRDTSALHMSYLVFVAVLPEAEMAILQQ